MGESKIRDNEILQQTGTVIRAVPSVSRYIPEKKRLSSDAFTESSDGSGVSVFDESCAIAANSSICAHIAKHYPSVVSDPPAYIRIPRVDLPAGSHVSPDPSNGDECHHNICGVHKNELRKWFREFSSREAVNFWCNGLESEPYSSPER
jgi:hypothetical protein